MDLHDVLKRQGFSNPVPGIPSPLFRMTSTMRLAGYFRRRGLTAQHSVQNNHDGTFTDVGRAGKIARIATAATNKQEWVSP